jgi:hypothetical protein
MALAQWAPIDAYLDVSGTFQVRTAFWLVAPSARVVPLTSFVSQVPVTNPAWLSLGIPVSIQQQFLAGTLVEQVVVVPVNGTSSQAQITTVLAAKFTTLQDALNTNVISVVHLVGGYYDGTTFHAGP